MGNFALSNQVSASSQTQFSVCFHIHFLSGRECKKWAYWAIIVFSGLKKILLQCHWSQFISGLNFCCIVPVPVDVSSPSDAWKDKRLCTDWQTKGHSAIRSRPQHGSQNHFRPSPHTESRRSWDYPNVSMGFPAKQIFYWCNSIETPVIWLPLPPQIFCNNIQQWLQGSIWLHGSLNRRHCFPMPGCKLCSSVNITADPAANEIHGSESAGSLRELIF